MNSQYVYKSLFRQYLQNKKSAPYPTSMSTNLSAAQEHYVQIHYTEFHPKHKINVDSMDIHTFRHCSKLCLSLHQFS